MSLQLDTFTASHYCEKARWALDYKELSYRENVWVPLLHFIPVKRLKVPHTTVPILRSESSLIQGSSAIIRWLDQHYPKPTLLPWPASEEKAIAELDQTLDRIGIHVRRFIYWHLLPNRPAALHALGMNAQGLSKKLLPIIFPFVKTGIMKALNINHASVQRSITAIQQGLDRVESVRRDRPYLWGDQFSLLDIAAASLIAPLSLPSEHPIYPHLIIPDSAQAALEPFQNHPAVHWVNRIYRRHRSKPEKSP